MEWRSPSSVMASSSSRSHMIVSKVSSGALKITRLSRRCRGFVHSQDSKSLLPSLGTCNTLARVTSRQLNYLPDSHFVLLTLMDTSFTAFFRMKPKQALENWKRNTICKKVLLGERKADLRTWNFNMLQLTEESRLAWPQRVNHTVGTLLLNDQGP